MNMCDNLEDIEESQGVVKEILDGSVAVQFTELPKGDLVWYRSNEYFRSQSDLNTAVSSERKRLKLPPRLPVQMSEFEKQREARIARNASVMLGLGLTSTLLSGR